MNCQTAAVWVQDSWPEAIQRLKAIKTYGKCLLLVALTI
jgi:hypothetical protein